MTPHSSLLRPRTATCSPVLKIADPQPSLWRSLRALYHFLSARRRAQLGLQTGLMLIGALAEMATLGALVPFLALLAAPGAPPFRIPALDLPLGIREASLLFAVIAVFSAILRIATQWAGFRFAFGLGGDLAREVFRRTLYQPYAWHVSRSSSEVLAGLTKVNAVVAGIINPLMQGIVALLISLGIMATLMLVDPRSALLAGVIIGALYVTTSLFVRRQVRHNGQIIAGNEPLRVKAVQEGLGGIRDVLLDGTQTFFSAAFDRVDSLSRRAQASNSLLANGPRYFIEAAGMVCIVAMAGWLSGRQGGLLGAIPILGALALGAQRLLPQLQFIYFAWSQISGTRAQLDDVLALTTLPIPADRDVHSLHSAPRLTADAASALVEMRAVSFRYAADGPPVLDSIDLEIPRGARIGFVGKTGCGKSTLIDLIMGLLDASSGTVLVDGAPLGAANRRLWQRRIAHVPQTIFLSDTSIAENIAFGMPRAQIDQQRLERAAAIAQLDTFIASLPDGFDTCVGERGVRLSGGQRQRIGLARALYRDVDVLVLDEATSALDDRTEAAVIRAIEALGRDVTLLMIAHRVSTLRRCDRIVELAEGRVLTMGAPAAVL